MDRILVIRGGALGDFVLTLPAIKLLREGFPRARLEILGYKHIVALAEERFYAQAVRSIEYAALAGFFAREADLSPELSAYFGSFDLIVSYLFDPDLIFERNLRRCGVEELLTGSPKITEGEHAAVQLARPLRELDLELTEHTTRVYPSPADNEFAENFLRECPGKILALHPGSGSARKNWPINRWLELCAALSGQMEGATLLIVGGEADQKELAAFRRHRGPRPVLFAENLKLPHLAAVLKRCAIFLGHDSGISHLVASVGTPGILLFGATNPQVWAPFNQHVQVVRAPEGDLSRLEVGVVAELAAQELMRIGIRT